MRQKHALLTERRCATLVGARQLSVAHRLDEVRMDVFEDRLHRVGGVVEPRLVLRAHPQLHHLDGTGLRQRGR